MSYIKEPILLKLSFPCIQVVLQSALTLLSSNPLALLKVKRRRYIRWCKKQWAVASWGEYVGCTAWAIVETRVDSTVHLAIYQNQTVPRDDF